MYTIIIHCMGLRRYKNVTIINKELILEQLSIHLGPSNFLKISEHFLKELCLCPLLFLRLAISHFFFGIA